MDSLLPPQEYDHVPAVPVIEQVLDYRPLQVWCSMFPGPAHLAFVKDKTHYFGGCSAFLPVDGVKTCFVWYLPGNESALRHERGHCNGWGQDHKGGR